jgi:hypothetical protein
MDDDYYGAPSSLSSGKSLGERLRDLYSADDFVKVMNIDTQPVTYQFAKPSDLETFSDYPGHKDTVQHNPPKRFTLKPGETKLCPAHEADMVIGVLIKQISTKETVNKIETGEYKPAQSTNWSDPEIQEKLIRQIYLGKQDILGNYNSDANTQKESVDKDLDINESPKQTQQRRTRSTL